MIVLGLLDLVLKIGVKMNFENEKNKKNIVKVKAL